MSENVAAAGTAVALEAASTISTAHGTILFVVPESGELRHGRAEEIPSNVLMVLDGDVARLNYLIGTERREIVCLPEFSAVVGSDLATRRQAPRAGTTFTRITGNDRGFGLQCGGLFLSAEPDGRLVLNRDHFLDWEKFHLRVDSSEISGTIVSNRIDGKLIHFFIHDRRDFIQSRLCRGDFYEREELDLIRSQLVPGTAFVDVGANVGNHTVFVSKFCNASEVIPFEPNLPAIRLLRINLALNDCTNVDTQFLGLALSSKAETFRVLSRKDPNLGGARMLPDHTGPIKGLRGDDALASRAIGFIKIDVEFMELDVLHGLHRVIEQSRPKILVESFDLGVLQAWCQESGYKVNKSLPNENHFLLPIP